MQDPHNTDRPIQVAILGGGIGGCMTALKLAELPNVTVTICEKNAELLAGSSNVTPGRMGLGFHYKHLPTAITYLHATVNWVKEFYTQCPHLRIGEEFPEAHYLRRGRYFIVKDSFFSTQEILATYQGIKAEYQRLVDEDPHNRVFGDPSSLFRILEPHEYAVENKVNLDNIDVAVETAEHLLDWANFRIFLLTKISQMKNIIVLPMHQVTDIDYTNDSNQYLIRLKNVGSHKRSEVLSADYVVNATWEYVDAINYKAGFIRSPLYQYDKDANNQIDLTKTKTIKEKNVFGEDIPDSSTFDLKDQNVRTNRLKVLAEVELPPELVDSHSMFFCMGPHCMFSNMGDGRGLISYAPDTNKIYSTGMELPSEYIDYLKGNKSEEEKQKLGEAIIAGVTLYIPSMAKAKLIGVRFGTVQTEGDANVFAHDSKFHERDYDGIKRLETGFISNACMKLLYGLENARTIVEDFKLFTKFRYIVNQYILPNLCNLDKMQQGIVLSWLRRVPIGTVDKKGSSFIPLDPFAKDFQEKLIKLISKLQLLIDSKPSVSSLNGKKLKKSNPRTLQISHVVSSAPQEFYNAKCNFNWSDAQYSSLPLFTVANSKALSSLPNNNRVIKKGKRSLEPTLEDSNTSDLSCNQTKSSDECDSPSGSPYIRRVRTSPDLLGRQDSTTKRKLDFTSTSDIFESKINAKVVPLPVSMIRSPGK